MQEARDIADRVGVGVAFHQSKEDGLEHIFGVAGVPGHPVRGAEHHTVVFLEDGFQVPGGDCSRFHGGSH